MRICSLLPSATEIVFALGLDDDLVGVTHECDYPPEARRLPAVTASIIDHEGRSSGRDSSPYLGGHPFGEQHLRPGPGEARTA